MSPKSVKVTDRRMFTLEGELKEEFRDLETRDVSEPETPTPSAPQPATPQPAAPQPAKTTPEPTSPPEPTPRAAGYPEPESRGPGFRDLIGLLAEPASIYLQEAQMGGIGTVGATAKAEQSLELARLHIDLMSVLREKTAGRLDPPEQAMLDDVLYRLQMGYVGVQG